jgi:hypothetical protein
MANSQYSCGFEAGFRNVPQSTFGCCEAFVNGFYGVSTGFCGFSSGFVRIWVYFARKS